jgi:RNA methyltransferase, TrmH family
MDRAYGDADGAGTSLRRHAAAATAVTAARRDPTRVVLEGVHAVKHAIRFGGEVELVATPDRHRLTALLAELAPDVVLPASHVVELPAAAWDQLVPRELPSPALGIARRPAHTATEVLHAPGRTLVLEEPRHLGNLGAAIRVAAAADAGGVLVVGDADPWHPTSVRAAAGLQFALPVARASALPPTPRRVVALDPGGGELGRGALHGDVVLLVGTERGGLSAAMLARADERVRLPMRAGVSSLNLATAVAAALYR